MAPLNLSIGITRNTPGLAKLLRRLRHQVDGAVARAGYLESGHALDATDSGLDLAALAAVHEFGAIIQHPAGTPYIVGPHGAAMFLAKGDPRAVGKTRPQAIVIPERSFLRSTLELHEFEYLDRIVRGLRAVLRGRSTARRVMNDLARQMAADIREHVLVGPEILPPDTDATIERKDAEGPGRYERWTLIDSGQLVDGVTAEAEVP